MTSLTVVCYFDDMSAGESDARAPGARRASGPVRAAKSRGLTHASVTELELQFAQNPRSDAYIALCEAYLAQGRFMEAMVVAKKGIKAHPDAVDAKLLLSRVYEAQRKFPRALQTLAAALASHPDDPRVYALRARVKLSNGDQAGAIQDLKRTLELDPSHPEARAQLSALGFAVPQTADVTTADVSESTELTPPTAAFRAQPEPDTARIPLAATRSASPSQGPQDIITSTGDLRIGDLGTSDVPPGRATSDIESGQFSFGSAPGEGLTFGAPEQTPGTGLAFSDAPRNEFNFDGAFGESVGIQPQPPELPDIQDPSLVPPTGMARAPRQKLEGEDELEQMAVNLPAEQKEKRGRPRTTALLLAVLLIVGGAVVVERLIYKNRVESIDRLTTEAEPAFKSDTYGGYKRAAALMEEVLKDYAPDHALTLGRLAHTYAILWTEHGEPVKERLDAVLELAKAKAPTVSHTVAASGLTSMHAVIDRRAGAKAALQVVQPMVDSTADGGASPTHADLTLGIIELALGDYERAEKRLAHVKQVLPGSVRAKVWHARAAFRSRRLGTALATYRAASRAEPNHAGALAGQALTLLERGDLARASEALKRFGDLQQRNPKEISTRDAALATYARSALLRADGQDTKATGLYEEAIRADPRNADFPFGLGRWLLQNDRAQEALVPLEQAIAMEPTRWIFHIEIAEAEMVVGQWDQAKLNIDEALAIAPDKPEVQLAKARWMRRRRQPGAEGYLKAMLKKYPSSRMYINLELGRLYRSQKKYSRAQKSLEKALADFERYPKVVQADVLISYGRLMLDRRRGETALKSFREAAKRGAAEGYYRIAFAQYTGDAKAKAEARKACDKLMAAGSSSGYARKARALCETL